MTIYIKKSYSSYKFVILVILIILILCALLYYKILYDKNNKVLNDSFSNYSDYSKKYIIGDCKSGWVKDYKLKYPNDIQTPDEICMSNAYVSNPKLLCGICGSNENNPLFTISSPNNPDKRYFGCSRNTNNSLSINWGDQGTPINKLLSDRLTCNTFNVNVDSSMYIYIASNDKCSILLNDNVVANHSGIDLGEYLIEDVKYGDELSIECTSEQGPSGLCFSYIWNKQIFILENNGYQNCANTIYYTSEGRIKWDDMWKNRSNGLLPWMKNWIKGDDMPKSSLNISTYIGSTKQDSFMNNDCVIFGSITFNKNQNHKYISDRYEKCSVFLLTYMNSKAGNTNLLYETNYKKNIDNYYYEYKLKNVNEGDNFVLVGFYKDEKNVMSILNYSICYIWCGRIFVTQQNNELDSIVEKISLKNVYDNADTAYDLVEKDIKNNDILYFQKKLLNPVLSDIPPSYIFSVNNGVISDNSKIEAKNTLDQLKVFVKKVEDLYNSS